MIGHEQLVEELKKLSESDLVKIYYEAISSRKKIIGSEIDDALIIGCGGLADEVNAAELYISALANPGAIEMDSLSQLGKCVRCQINIQCTAKEALCPICGSNVECL